MSTIIQRITIDAPQSDVWEILADVGGAARWAPTLSHSTVTTQATQGIGCERECDVHGFGKTTEVITEWQDGRKMGYDVNFEGAPLIRSVHNSFTLSADGDRTIVTLVSNFRMKGGPAGALLDRLVVRRKLGKTIRESLAGLKYYAETGEKIGVEQLAAAASAA